MIFTLCLCDRLPRLALATRVTILLHCSEVEKTTNTGTLAVRCLTNSAVLVRGAKDMRLDGRALIAEGYENVVLYPADTARPLGALARGALPLNLIVPDGTWSQAGRMARRETALAGLARVSLPDLPRTTYQLRRETRDGGGATLEAIAAAIAIAEQGPSGAEAARALAAVFRVFVERTLWSRGLLEAARVTGGIPPAALHYHNTRND